VVLLQLLFLLKSKNHGRMRRLSAVLRSFLLLAVALTVAAHPLARSLSLSQLSADPTLPELRVVICTAHGAVAVDEPAETPQPGKDTPSCLWCATGGEATGKLPALAATEAGLLNPPKLLQQRIATAQLILPSASADRSAHAPRGPPRVVAA
jgi:hypothetical protein